MSGIDFRINTAAFNASSTGEYSVHLYGSQISSWISDIDYSKPFAMVMSFQSPHTPLEAPSTATKYVNSLRTYKTKARKEYCGMLYEFDSQIGSIISDLKSASLWDDTLLLFFADNGPSDVGSAYPLRGIKASLFEGGIRTPAFISGGYSNMDEKASVSSQTIHITDIFPTLCTIAEMDCSELSFDGIDITEHLFEDEEIERGSILLNVDSWGCAGNNDEKVCFETPIVCFRPHKPMCVNRFVGESAVVI